MRRTARVMLPSIALSFLFATPVVAGRSGIWKPADGSNNFYIQTYSTESCVVIVTPDGEHFQVFLDGECGDDVVAFEYFGRLAAVETADIIPARSDPPDGAFQDHEHRAPISP